MATKAESPDIGTCTVCLNVRDVKRSSEFYAKLGFRATGGSLAENWVLMEHGNFKLGLYQGHIESNLLNFRGGDVFAIARHLEAQDMKLRMPAQVEPDGSAGATIADPDGNVIYFNTATGEQDTTGRIRDSRPIR